MTNRISIMEGPGRINAAAMADLWWTITLRGVAAILFGVLAFVAPRAALYTLVILFGAYVLVDGVFNLVLAFRRSQSGRRWGTALFAGIVDIAAGVIALFWPGITALVLLWLIAARSLIVGVTEISAAVRLRKQIEGEWLLALNGLLAFAFGVLLFLYPGAGALAVVLWIAAWAIITGVVLIALSLRLRHWGHGPQRPFPTGGLPRAA